MFLLTCWCAFLRKKVQFSRDNKKKLVFEKPRVKTLRFLRTEISLNRNSLTPLWEAGTLSNNSLCVWVLLRVYSRSCCLSARRCCPAVPHSCCWGAEGASCAIGGKRDRCWRLELFTTSSLNEEKTRFFKLDLWFSSWEWMQIPIWASLLTKKLRVWYQNYEICFCFTLELEETRDWKQGRFFYWSLLMFGKTQRVKRVIYKVKANRLPWWLKINPRSNKKTMLWTEMMSEWKLEVAFHKSRKKLSMQ